MKNKKNNYLIKIILIIFSLIILLIIYFYLNLPKNNIKAIENWKINKKLVVTNNKNISIEKLNLLVNEQKFNEALTILNSQYKKNPNIENILNYSNVLSDLWSLERKEKEYWKIAIEFANQALQLDPNNSEAYRIIWYANEIMENYDEAFVNYNKAIELNESNALAYSNRGHASELIWNTDVALKDFLKAYKLNPKLDHTTANLAKIYFSKWDYKKAEFFYNKVLENSNNTRFKAESLCMAWMNYINNNDFEKADKTFRRAIIMDPNYELWYIGLSRAQFFIFLKQVKKGNANNNLVDDSINNLKIAIKINPNKSLWYYQLALIDIDLQLYNDAESNFKKALKVLPLDITLSKDEKIEMKKLINNKYTKWE